MFAPTNMTVCYRIANNQTNVVHVKLDAYNTHIDVQRKRLDLELGDYHALVIGNNDYGDMPKLKTAVADAEAVSEVLEDRYGFSVTTLINATRTDMIDAMSGLRAALSYDTNLLIYYAGHGIVGCLGRWSVPARARARRR